jgi:hypothetical protein
MPGSMIPGRWNKAAALGAMLLIVLGTLSAEARVRKDDAEIAMQRRAVRVERRATPPPSFGGVPSFDGVVTGRPRTCGFDSFRYDDEGVPQGPYCH